jgi:hypothetical protein
MEPVFHCRHHPVNGKAELPPLPPAVAMEFHLVLKELASTALARYAGRPYGPIKPVEDQ